MYDLKAAIRIGAIFAPLLAWGTSGTDSVHVVNVARGPSAGQVTLSWTGGVAPFSVYRATSPTDVELAGSYVGESSTASYTDTPPAGQLFYYFVKPSCFYDPPERCNGIDDDCNGAIDDGFTGDTNPACASYDNVGSIPADLGSSGVYASGTTEQWLRVNLVESTSGDYDLSAMFFLYSPPGTDFDLYVRCEGCSGGTNGWSFIHSLAGHTDSTFTLRRDSDRIDTFPVLIEVRAYAQTACGTWQLSVIGNTGGEYETCRNP